MKLSWWRSHGLRSFALLWGAFFPAASWAGTLFVSDPSDASLRYLSALFGRVGPHFSGSEYGDIVAGPVFSTLFSVFNLGVVTVGALVLSYTTLMASLQTAHHGKLMGQQWSSLWIPLRTILGYGILVPTLSGYSLIQIAFMWCVIQGTGFANLIWSGVMDHYAAGYSIAQNDTEDLNPYTEEFQTFMKNVFEISACMHYFNQSDDPDKARLHGLSSTASQVMVYADLDPSPNAPLLKWHIGMPYEPNPRLHNICGTLSYSHNRLTEVEHKLNKSHADTHKAVERIRQSALLEMGFLAQDMGAWLTKISEEYGSTFFKARLSPLSPAANHAFYSAVSSSYVAMLNQRHVNFNSITSQIIAALPAEVAGARGKFSQEAKKTGWLLAGSFYYNLNLAPTDPPKTYLHKIPDQFSQGFLDSQPRSWINQGKQAFQGTEFPEDELTIVSDTLASAHAKGPGLDAIYRMTFGTMGKRITHSLKNDLMGEMEDGKVRDPLNKAIQFGNKMIAITELAFYSYFTIALLLIIVSTFTAKQGLGDMVNAVVQIMSLLLAILMAITWTSGVLLAYYLPIIPYLVYLSGVLTWFILVIEAMVAAPIVALAYTSPSQDEMGPAKNAVLLLANICLRPALLVLSLVLAARLVIAIFSFVNLTLVETLNSVSSIGFFGSVGLLTTFTAWVILVAQECFSLIYVLPDRTIRWVGGKAEHSSGKKFMDDAERGAKEGAEKAREAAVGAMQFVNKMTAMSTGSTTDEVVNVEEDNPIDADSQAAVEAQDGDTPAQGDSKAPAGGDDASGGSSGGKSGGKAAGGSPK